MAFRSGSLSRSLMSTARASLRPAAPSSTLPRLRPPPLAAPRVQSRRFSMPASRCCLTSFFLIIDNEIEIVSIRISNQPSFAYLWFGIHLCNFLASVVLILRMLYFFFNRNLGQLGCTHSLLPLGITCMTSHSAVSARACCELSHGTFRRSCQDR